MSPGKPDNATGASQRDEILADLLAHGRFLGSLSSLGVTWPPPGVEASAGAPAAAERPADPEKALQAVKDDIGDCQRCRLSRGRKTIVYGQGNPRAELMFVG